MQEEIIPHQNEEGQDLEQFGYNAAPDADHLTAAPEFSAQDLADMASQSEAIEQDEEFNYFDYDFEQVTQPEPEHVKVPEAETF